MQERLAVQKIDRFCCGAELRCKETGRERRQTPGAETHPRCLAFDSGTA